MRVVPAIDLRGGRCVRLRQGRFDAVTVYHGDPRAQADAFVAAGARWIHVVDLDGAQSGKRRNRAAVAAIARSGALLQVGGGLRDLAAIEEALSAGVRRVILGTVAVREPELLATACERFPGRILVGIDARDGQVSVEAWTSDTDRSAVEVGVLARDAGVAGLVYTDIHRDGMGTGANVEATVKVAGEVGIPVIASGGIHSLADIEALDGRPGIEGVIVGRAIYEGTVDVGVACSRWQSSSLLGEE